MEIDDSNHASGAPLPGDPPLPFPPGHTAQPPGPFARRRCSTHHDTATATTAADRGHATIAARARAAGIRAVAEAVDLTLLR
ncbi:hypothetical protein GCM10018962_31020 [Dactylosporangium matsuzakiense]|uniref:Uncharacterized protein n=1 Tax=Dactylosporangium matsuzakiense TaxID=53360 RepID=A0A9W6NMN5_9ACTN|nr:hypothetical protein GCM10017581_043660 [Dactylosporangium matsuzakiense]